MHPFWIVPAVDEFRECRVRFAMRMKGGAVQQFVLERGEEPFGDGIIPTIAASAHAGIIWCAARSAR